MQTPSQTTLAQHIQLPFSSREEAGRLLAHRVFNLHLDLHHTVVLALPRGGVPIGAAVAAALHAPLDLLLVRKIGVPGQPELALAAIAEGQPPYVVLDEAVQAIEQVSPIWIEAAAQREQAELVRRREVYGQGHPPIDLSGRDVILVDDGLATGTTVRAGLAALRDQGAARVILAVPVAASEAIQLLSKQVDQVVCLAEPHPFGAIGSHYLDFHQLQDSEVIELLRLAQSHGKQGHA
jgi:putative phosphoribosyl transferase